MHNSARSKLLSDFLLRVQLPVYHRKKVSKTPVACLNVTPSTVRRAGELNPDAKYQGPPPDSILSAVLVARMVNLLLGTQALQMDPGFVFNSCTVNRNYASRPHRDTANSCRSLIWVFGNFQGGELIVNGVPVE